MVAVGSFFFFFNTLYYYLTGSYEANPNVWYEVIGPLHNPILWGLSFIFVEVQLIIQNQINQRKSMIKFSNLKLLFIQITKGFIFD
jgi:hypothetical protein